MTRQISAGSTVSIGLIAGGIGFVLQAVAWAFWFGGRLEAQKRETLDEVQQRFVSKEVSETRWQSSNNMVNAELVIIRRDLSELRQVAAEIPKISAKLETMLGKDRR